VIRLAVRLAMAGGREPLARFAATAIGVAMGAGLLLLAAALYPALHAHDARLAWTSTSAHNVRPAPHPAGTDPLLWRLRTDVYDGRPVVWADVAAVGPRAPVPPGLSRLPGPGQLAVSAALARLLRSTPARLLGDRFPGRIVATVGNAALLGPGELVVFAGHAPARLRGQPGVIEVRSIESAPRSVALTRLGRVAVGVGVIALLAPILVLIVTATRLAAARREQRLAALRLAGATPGQTRLAAAVEATAATAAGTALGFAAFAAGRPQAARLNIDGAPFFPADLRLPSGAAALVAIGLPVLGASGALASLRRVQISPLGVTRQVTPPRLTWRRLVPLILGLALFAAAEPALSAAKGSDWPTILLFANIGLVIGGIMAAGPLLTVAVGRLLTALARRPPALLAGRRLTGSPAAGFRAISGLILAVFVVTLVSEFAAGAQAPDAGAGRLRLPAGTVVGQLAGPQEPALSPAGATALNRKLAGIAGVRRVVGLRVAPRQRALAHPASPDSSLQVVARCADLLATRMATCAEPGATVRISAELLAKGAFVGVTVARARPLPAAPLGSLPLAGVIAITDGRPSSVEAVRTAVEVATGSNNEFLPETAADISAQDRQQATTLGRIADAGLLLTLLVAGLSLAISVAGGLLDRRRPFALLRLGGMPRRDLNRMLLAETALPLFAIAVTSTGLGMLLAGYAMWTSQAAWQPPSPAFWPALGAGLLLALALSSAASMPLLGRLTSLDAVRFE